MSRPCAPVLRRALLARAPWPCCAGCSADPGRRRATPDRAGAAAAGRLGRPVPLRRGHPRPQGRRHQRRRPRDPGQPGHHRLGRRWRSRPSRSPATRCRPGRPPPSRSRTAHRGAASRRGPTRCWSRSSTAAPAGCRCASEDPRLLDRLHAKACAAQRLDRGRDRRTCGSATATERLRGEEYLPGDLVIRHRPGSTARCGWSTSAGACCSTSCPGPGAARCRAELRAGRDGAARSRCCSARRTAATPHARGQSSQTFLISAYVRLGTDPVQRVVLPLSTEERDRLNGILDRDCHGAASRRQSRRVGVVPAARVAGSASFPPPESPGRRRSRRQSRRVSGGRR